jgi:cytochrome c oxidase cbb3-type subunit III
MASEAQSGAGRGGYDIERDEALAKQEIKEEQDRLAFGKSTAELEWDGIRKLDYPPPRWWVVTFWGSFIIAIIWWILYPSWPFFNAYSPGLLGYDQREDVARDLAAGRERQAVYLERIASLDTASVQADSDLRAFALVGGEVLFKENCAGCHGLGGAGQAAFPSLADDEWIWGGTIEEIEQTIRHGVRNGQDPEARDSIMPAFGSDGILSRQQIEEVAYYVLSLTGRAAGKEEAAAAGEPLFVENCVACHGEGGVGMLEVGAPALNDSVWIYGGELHDVVAQIGRPKLGVMPFWQGRLDDSLIKMLAVYVHGLGGGR